MRPTIQLSAVAFGGAIALAALGLIALVRSDLAVRRRFDRTQRAAETFYRRADSIVLRLDPLPLVQERADA